MSVVNVQQYNVARWAQDRQKELERASAAAATITVDPESAVAPSLTDLARKAASAAEGLLSGRQGGARVYLLEGYTLVSIEANGTEFVKHGDGRTGIIGHVLQNLEWVKVSDTSEDQSFDPEVDCNKGGPGCLICPPLEVEGCGCIGAITVLRDVGDEFSSLEIELLKQPARVQVGKGKR